MKNSSKILPDIQTNEKDSSVDDVNKTPTKSKRGLLGRRSTAALTSYFQGSFLQQDVLEARIDQLLQTKKGKNREKRSPKIMKSNLKFRVPSANSPRNNNWFFNLFPMFRRRRTKQQGTPPPPQNDNREEKKFNEVP